MSDKVNTTAHGKAYDGTFCPHCQSTSIKGGEIEVEGTMAFQRCSCQACESEWCEEYRLSGYSNLEVGNQENEDEKVSSDERLKVSFVRTSESTDFDVLWNIETNLSDRWGDLNFHQRDQKPGLSVLESSATLHDTLRTMMVDELTFIARKDGEFGVLFEQEFCTRESEAGEAQGSEEYLPEIEMIERVAGKVRELEQQFPHVAFAVPTTNEVYNGRVALWAFVALKDRDLVELQALGDAFLEAAYGKQARDA